MDLLKGLTNDMNIIYVTKGDLTVLICRVWTAVLKATAFELVGASIKQGSCIKDFHKSIPIFLSVVAKTDLTYKLFITSVSCAEEEGTRLAAPPN